MMIGIWKKITGKEKNNANQITIDIDDNSSFTNKPKEVKAHPLPSNILEEELSFSSKEQEKNNENDNEQGMWEINKHDIKVEKKEEKNLEELLTIPHESTKISYQFQESRDRKNEDVSLQAENLDSTHERSDLPFQDHPERLESNSSNSTLGLKSLFESSLEDPQRSRQQTLSKGQEIEVLLQNIRYLQTSQESLQKQFKEDIFSLKNNVMKRTLVLISVFIAIFFLVNVWWVWSMKKISSVKDKPSEEKSK